MPRAMDRKPRRKQQVRSYGPEIEHTLWVITESLDTVEQIYLLDQPYDRMWVHYPDQDLR